MTAQRKIRVATVGAGYFSHFHYDAWKRIPNVEIVGVFDKDSTKSTLISSAIGVPSYSSLDELLDRSKPDLVDIITPPQTHLELVTKVAERNLSMICQKAFCLSIEEAEAAVSVTEKAGVLLVIHENFRFQPWYVEIKRLLDSGAIGDVYQIAFRLRPGDGQGPNAYLDRQPYFQKMARFLIHETAVHWIDTFRYLLGEPSALTANLRRLNPAIAGEDAGHILFEYASGARALFDGNRLSDHAADNHRLTMGEFVAEGSAGTIRLDGFGRVFLRPFKSNSEQQIDYRWSNLGFGGDCVYRLQDHVVRHLLADGLVQNAGRDYLPVLYTERAVYLSHEQSRKVTL